MNGEFTIIRTQPYTYLDETGEAVQGYRVVFRMTEFNEQHQVYVRSLDPSVVNPAIKTVVEQRKLLAQ
jgi:hypothetical protein